MHVGRQKDSCSNYMGGMKLTEEEAEKDLGGLDLIRHEVFSAMYVLYALNKASRVTGMIKRMIRFTKVRIMFI